jgi:hypothetical protein
MRTADHVEPYTDYEKTGRLVMLRPRELGPWHSGVPHVYVSKARPGVDRTAVGFAPGEMSLAEVAHRLSGAATTDELREAFGGRAYDEAVAESLRQLDRLAEELAQSERLAEPLRKAIQSSDRGVRGRARDRMARVGLTESDLCTAWHHLPRDRRGWIAEALRRVAGGG